MKHEKERTKYVEARPEKAGELAKKLHIKKDEIQFVRKSYISEKGDVNEKERSIIATVSTADRDRDGEIIEPTGIDLKDYQKNPVLMWAHTYKEPPIGRMMWGKIDKEKGMICKFQFAKTQFADEIYNLYKDGYLKGFSIGFVPLDFDEKEKIHKKIALLEISAVPVPSNQNALIMEAYTKGIIKSSRLKKDLEIEVVKDEDIEIEFIKGDGGVITFGRKDKEIEVIKEKHRHEWEEVKGRRGDPSKPTAICIKCGEHSFDAIELLISEGMSDKKEKEIKGEKAEKAGAEEEKAIENVQKDIDRLSRGGEKYTQAFIEKYELSIPETATSLMDIIKRFAKKYKYNISYDKKGDVVITKPETTDQYHRIPVNPGCKITATITISAKEGIKALYCGEVKKVHTYLFDVKKWTMAEAKKWVAEHKDFKDIKIKELEYKERWNKSLSKAFDIAAVQAPIASFSYALYEKFLECKVKDVFLNSYSIPSPLLGTYLAGFKEILGDFKLKDTRSFNWDGREVPPIHEVIKLNSDKSDDFLINGVNFYDADSKPLIVKFSLSWDGIDVSIVTSSKNKEWNKELLDKVHDWAYENNFLRGEKFALSGEFLDEPGDDWDNLILDSKYKDSIIKSANFLEKKGKNLTGRGLLFIGPPGTGKTKTGRVLMNELDTTFIWVSSRDFRYIGPLKALSLGFSLARDLAPSILFLEDIDTWLRGEMEFVTDLVKTEMDGIKQNKGLITIMTSNYPEKLPDALLDRPGRFHHIINFELPKEKERKEMLTLWAGDIEEKLLDDIIEKTKGFSGAHLKELVEFAKMIAEEDETEIGKALLKSLDKLIEQRELIGEIKDNKVEVKAVWGKVKWFDGEVTIGRTWDELSDEEKEYSKKTGKSLPTVELRIMDIPEFKEYMGTLQDQVTELKEGRVLSTKNRTMVKDTIDALTVLKERLDELYNATEPPSREEERTAEIAVEKSLIVEKDSKKPELDDKLAKAIEKVLSGDNLKELLSKAVGEAVDIKIKRKLGRVE